MGGCANRAALPDVYMWSGGAVKKTLKKTLKKMCRIKKEKKTVVLSYFKISNVSIEREEVMKSRMDERHAVMAGLLASKLLWYPVAINLRLLART